MAIRFRRVSRLCDPTNKEAGKKVYPVISYQYDTQRWMSLQRRLRLLPVSARVKRLVY